MRAKLIFYTLSLALMAGGVWYAFDARLERLAAERERAMADVRREQVQAQVQRAETRLAAANEETKRAQAATAAKVRPPAAAKTEPAARAAPPREAAAAIALRDALLNDPHLQNLQLAAVQSKIAG